MAKIPPIRLLEIGAATEYRAMLPYIYGKEV
jgi:hypothetical protein